VVLKLGRFEKQIRNTLEVLKCGVGEGWRRPVEPIVCEMKKYCVQSKGKGIPYILVQ
jgi:hypothetical protein